MKTTSHSNKSGIALLFVLIIMMIAGVLAIGSMAKSKGLSIAAIRTNQRAQTQWLCEMGLERTTEEFYDENFSGASFNTNHSGQAISVTVVATSIGVEDSIEKFDVTSTASFDGRTTEIYQLFEVEREIETNSVPSLYIGLSEDGSNVVFTLKSGTIISTLSDLWNEIFILGEVDLNNGAILDDVTISLTGEYSGGLTNAVTGGVEIDPATEVISAIRTMMEDYETDITTGGSTPPTSLNQSITVTIPEGETWEVSSLTLGNKDSLVINGSGTLIVTGSIVVNNGGTFTTPDGLTLLVGGNIDSKNGASFSATHEDSIIYCGGSMTLFNSSDNVSGTILVEGAYDQKSSSTTDGYIFCDGLLTLNANSIFQGVIMADEVYAYSGAEIKMDDTRIPNWLQILLSTLAEDEVPDGSVIDVRRLNWALN